MPPPDILQWNFLKCSHNAEAVFEQLCKNLNLVFFSNLLRLWSFIYAQLFEQHFSQLEVWTLTVTLILPFLSFLFQICCCVWDRVLLHEPIFAKLKLLDTCPHT